MYYTLFNVANGNALVLMLELGEKCRDVGGGVEDVRNRYVRGIELLCAKLCSLPYLTLPYLFIRLNGSVTVRVRSVSQVGLHKARIVTLMPLPSLY